MGWLYRNKSSLLIGAIPVTSGLLLALLCPPAGFHVYAITITATTAKVLGGLCTSVAGLSTIIQIYKRERDLKNQDGVGEEAHSDSSHRKRDGQGHFSTAVYGSLALLSKTTLEEKNTMFKSDSDLLLKKPAWSLRGFFEGKESREQLAYDQAIKEYAEEREVQQNQKKKVRVALIQFLKDSYVVSQELKQQQRQLVKQLEDSAVVEEKAHQSAEEAVPAQNNNIQERLDRLAWGLNNYPVLGDYRKPTASDIQRDLESRKNHHAEVMAIAEQIFPDLFADLSRHQNNLLYKPTY